MHVIATSRSKTETAQVEENGRKKVAKLGMKAETRDGTEYEFTTVLDIVHDGHYAVASKDRTGLFSDQDPHKITAATGKTILDWLESGATPIVEQVGMDENAIADHLAAITAASTMDELKTAFIPAWRAANAAKDITALAEFDHAKTQMKARLTAPTDWDRDMAEQAGAQA